VQKYGKYLVIIPTIVDLGKFFKRFELEKNGLVKAYCLFPDKIGQSAQFYELNEASSD
jgi:hypothetical protein